MGRMEGPDGSIVELRARHLVGRSRMCNLRIDGRAVSGEHAIVWWQDNGWFVRDLGSTNGTFVDGQPLDPGEQRPVGPGSTIGFGEPDGGYQLLEASDPGAHAIEASGTTRLAADGMLVLPDADSAEVSVFEGVGGSWICERDDETIPIFDLDYVRAGSGRWQLHLPELQASTWVARTDGPTLENSTFRFEVSRDEEYVRLVLEWGGGEVDLGDRAHHYTLLTLARAREADQEAGDVPTAEHGWVYHDELMRMLAADATKVRVDIYRARKQLSAADVGGAAGVVERRATTKQLRFGGGSIKVVPLA